MAQRRRQADRTMNREPHPGKGRSKDRDRHLEDKRHHTATHPVPHPAHHTRVKPTGIPQHAPHTHPPEEKFNLDHGTHADRPRPGKLMKKETPSKRTGK